MSTLEKSTRKKLISTDYIEIHDERGKVIGYIKDGKLVKTKDIKEENDGTTD